MVDNNTAVERAKAIQEMSKSIRDLLTVKVTVPVGYDMLKFIHTNMFIKMKIPDEFKVENFEHIANAMNNKYNRYYKYEKDRWYVEAVTVNCDNSKYTLDLELNPFPSTLIDYMDKNKDLSKKMLDITSKGTTTTSTKKSTNTTNSTKNTTLKGGQGKFIDNLVKDIVGKETDPLKKAKAIYNAFKKHTYYSLYYTPNPYKSGSLEKAWKNAHLNCGDGANVLCGMYLSAGLTARIIKITSHYVVRLKINGKYYFTDCSGRDGGKVNKDFGTVWTVNGHRTYVSGTNMGTKLTPNNC